MKNKIFTFTLMLFFAASPFSLIKGQNQVSKSGFFKFLSLDPVMTLHNKTATPITCITIDYKIDGKQMQKFKFGGTLPANTSVDIPLPRMQVSNGMHFFDASVASSGGESLKNKTFAEGLSFIISPGNRLTTGVLSDGNNEKEIVKNKSACSCENGDGLDEDISFWFSVYLNDRHQLDAFGSTDKGKIWFPGQWDERAGLENDWNQAVFADPANRNRTYKLTVSTESVPENLTDFGITENKTSSTELNVFKCSAYPNPFSNNVKIQYNLTKDAIVDIRIADISGKTLAHPVQQLQHGKGNFTFTYKASKLSPGVYYCIIQSGNKKQTLKLVKK